MALKEELQQEQSLMLYEQSNRLDKTRTFSDESGNEISCLGSVKDMKTDDFPLPAHFANIG
jgi:hypothetical protein